MAEVTAISTKSDLRGHAKTVLAAILDVHQPKGQALFEVAVILFTYDRQNSEVRQIVDSYVGMSNWVAGGVEQAPEPASDLPPANETGISFDPLRVGEMLDKPEFLIAHNAEFAQSFVCRLYESTRTKHWKCSKKDIDWNRLGMQSNEFDWLLKHHQIEMNGLDVEQNGALALLHLLRLQSADGTPYLSHLLQE